MRQRNSGILNSAAASAAIVAAGLRDMLTPPACPLSGEPVEGTGVIAAAAWSDLAFIDDPVCDRCGAPFAHDFGPGAVCAACIAEPPDFDSARAAVVYGESAHKLIVSFKYSDRTDLTPLFARWLARAGAPLLAPDVLLVPAPLHRSRLLSRRYNQAAALANALARLTGLAVEPMLLKRTRATPPQASLPREARRRNVAGAFAVRREKAAIAAGRRIILIDDVLTTGATLSASARALKKAGAANVAALVIARVARNGVALG